MAGAVERVLHEGGVLLVEAGTGTGKTLAYLVPALLSGRRVVVSTGTKNLQDQIFRKELPFLGERAGIPVSACLVKGRDNYLCRTKWVEFEREPLLEVRDEARLLPLLREWAPRTKTGDRAELPDLPDEARFWRDINARADTCTGAKCPEYEACFLTRLRRSAEEAQLVLVNHHLFFADLSLRGPFGAVLPDYDTVIFDEAHLLEEIATQFLGTQVSAAQLEELARDAEKMAAADGGATTGGGGAAQLREASAGLFEPIRTLLSRATGRVPFRAPADGGPTLDSEGAALDRALREVARSAGNGLNPAGDAAAGIALRADGLRVAFAEICRRDQEGMVYGMESRGRTNVVLTASPIDVGEILAERLFPRLHACVMTSATLAVEEKFDHVARGLGIPDPQTLIVESPFHWQDQAVLYLPSGIPEPRHELFISRAVEEIRQLLRITDGRAFLLFTSYAVLDRVRDELEADDAWSLFVQGEESKAALVERFRETERAVLLGTTSFWHGVDVAGSALSLVVVDKLPFDVPSDPLVAAKIRRIRDSGGNPFVEYQTPAPVLELKQGLGRLIRSRSDRGILCVLDPRLRTKPYGRVFLRSLPPVPVVRDRMDCARFFQASRIP
jgi:ATP-dependent DNA helicase DinG